MEVLDKHVRARLVDTQSDLVRERIRLKKRRLESHFKESRNVTRAAFTIAVEEVGDSVIGGYFLRLSARAPVSYIPVAFRFTSMPVMERCRALLNGEEPPKDLIEETVCLFCGSLPKVEIFSCMKGPFFEKMQSKMSLAKNHRINEIVSLDFEVVAKSLLNAES